MTNTGPPLAVAAAPTPWPLAPARLDQVSVAVLFIDFQHDFCSPGGMADLQGYDIAQLHGARREARRVLDAARTLGWTVVHTRVGRPAGSPGAGSGPLGRHLVQGEPGYQLVDDLAPVDGEIVVDKPGKGAFRFTSLDEELRERGITHLVFAGVTSDVCVTSTFREAHDLGYSCLVLSDATASYWPEAHAAAMTLVVAQDGLLGRRATTDQLLAAALPAAALSEGSSS